GAPPRIPMHERLLATATPVQYIVGEFDMITPPDLIAMCHGLLPGSRYHLVKDSGHSAYWEKASEFNAIALRFLLEIDAAAKPD
ncbi:MAG TPA: alpha/beta fold hydrolase, partial [Dehalococcoidia bacterium]|nr:alpha/beta fold hydrolase [Dehalococcoidia bacterium]